MKKILLLLLCFITLTASAVGFKGTEPVVGGQYYLYNVYQAKFLSYGNTWGTQVSLDNQRPLLCTLEASGGGVVINTHFSLSSQSYNASVNNYIVVDNDGLPYVNSNWGDSDDNPNVRAPQVWDIKAVEEGYSISFVNDDSRALLFGEEGRQGNDADQIVYVGTACTIGSLSGTLNQDRGTWRFVSKEDYEAYLAKKKFTFAALNVDGMPKSVKVAGVYEVKLNPDAKEAAGATAIGQKLKTMGYDVIGVSEDFNYHSQIWDEAWNGGVDGEGVFSYNAATHRGKIDAGLNAVSKYLAKETIFDIDGLGLFYKQNHIQFSNESWTKWNDHYGYTDSGADGLIAKGFRFYTITLEDGTLIDLYILHMDAESSEGDNLARESQLNQLVTAIKASHNGHPIIVMGDTNCRYTRDRLKELFIDAINADERFTVHDGWIEKGRKGRYPIYGSGSIMASGDGGIGYRKGEVVDKLFYINNTESDIRIELEDWCQDLSFINEAKEPLADHWPGVGVFSYHDYDPAIDDVEDDDEEEQTGEFDDSKTYYIRNVETGLFLKAGGSWNTHAVLGKYGRAMNISELSEGKYVLATGMGSLGHNIYMDFNGEDAWEIAKTGNYYHIFWNDNGVKRALTGNGWTYLNDGANVRYVESEDFNASSNMQKWEILTLDDLKAEMEFASASHPVNITHLFGSANFDRNDKVASDWTFTKKDVGNFNFVVGQDWDNIVKVCSPIDGNPNAEVFCSTISGWSSNKSNWTLTHSRLTGLKNGTYKVTFQGFYRDGDASANYTSTTSHTKLYANTASVDVMSICAGIETSSIAEGDYKIKNGYVPNNLYSASVYFNRGKYVHELTCVVTDGTLTIKLDKDHTKTSSWTCFDNFQIEYLGALGDGAQYYFYNADAGQFLTEGNSYGTQASLSSEGKVWEMKPAVGGYSLNRKGQNNYLFIASNGLYVDGANAGVWNIEKNADGYYTIADNEGKYIGWAGDLSTVVVPSILANDREMRGMRWSLMSAEEYNANRETIASALSARQAAWTVMCSAINNGVDYADLKQLYYDVTSTAEVITDAANAVKASIISRCALASESNPVDVSFLVANAGVGDDSNVHAGWNVDGEWGNNITSMPSNAAEGIALAGRFYEKWVGSPNTLDNATLSQVVNALPEGKYALMVDALAVQQDGNNSDINGVSLFIGDKNVTVSTPNGVPATFMTPICEIEGDNQSLTLGFKLEGTNANWVAFDNFHLIYLGKLDILLGDVNKDGIVSLSDLTSLIDILLGNDNSKTKYNHRAADINTDGIVNDADVDALRIILLYE